MPFALFIRNVAKSIRLSPECVPNGNVNKKRGTYKNYPISVIHVNISCVSGIRLKMHISNGIPRRASNCLEPSALYTLLAMEDLYLFYSGFIYFSAVSLVVNGDAYVYDISTIVFPMRRGRG